MSDLIQWRDDFSLGIEYVDLEHRELINLINDLHTAMGHNAEQVQVVSALGEIFAQISAHFALEEKYMRETGYKAYPLHKEDHEKLLDELRDIMDRVEDDGRYDEKEMSQQLDSWFSEHFRTHDARLHRHEIESGSQR